MYFYRLSQKDCSVQPGPKVTPKLSNYNNKMFKFLAQVNKWLLPSFTKKGLDLAKAKKWQKALLAWKYYVTTRALD